MERVFLEIKNMSVSYGTKEVVKDCDITLREGRLTALLGLNGSGKTTMLKAACGLLKSRSKSWEICGEDAGHMKERRRARLVSYVPQKNTIIYSIAATDVVAMGFHPYIKIFSSPTKAQKEIARNVIRELGLGEKADEDFLSLSEGQKQLIILARSMVQNAPVMLFDEPDSTLDFLNHHLILSKIRDVIYRGKKCGLITLHDPNFALEYCDEILILKEGRILDSLIPREATVTEMEKKLSGLYDNIEILKHNGRFVLIKGTP